MGKFFMNILEAKWILLIFLFDVVTQKSTYSVIGTATTYWKFQDCNECSIDSVMVLRCRICRFLYNSSNPALCINPCSACSSLDIIAAPLPDCSVAKNEADSWEDIGGRLYTYHTKTLSWDDANAKCVELGMHLVSVETFTKLIDIIFKFPLMVPDNTWVEIKDIATGQAWINLLVVLFRNSGKDCVNGSSMPTVPCVPQMKTFICEREEPCT